VLLWRYFAHYLDDDIAKTYIDVIKIENQLEVPSSISLYDNLVDSLTDFKEFSKKNQKNKIWNQSLKQLSDDKKVKSFEWLYQNKKMGYRGHNKWDFFALLIIATSLFGFIVFCEYFGIVIIAGLLIPVLSVIVLFKSEVVQANQLIPDDFEKMLEEIEISPK
jgi:hypothetical protein